MKQKITLRLSALLLVCLLALPVLASCSVSMGPPLPSKVPLPGEPVDQEQFLSDRNPYADIDEDVFDIGDTSLVYRYTEENEQYFRERIEIANGLLEDGSKKNEKVFLSLYEELDELYGLLIDQSRLAYIEYCLFGEDEEVSANYLYINALQTDILQDLIVMYQTIYDSPYRDAFYEGWTEQEIRQALDQAAMYTDKFVELQNRSDELLVAYRELNAYDTDEGQAAIRDLYIDFIAVQNEIARELGYSDYMEYAYESVYGRDYSVEDVEQIVAWNTEYLVPLLVDTYNAFVDDYLSLSEESQDLVFSLLFDYPYDGFAASIALRKYYKSLGTEALEYYNDFLKNGKYFRSKDADSYQGAFTWYLYTYESPILYFGPGYDSLYTFVHEFGHYSAYLFDGRGSMDLSEVQSQGSEMLFTVFAGSVFGETVMEAVAEYNCFQALFDLCQQLIINEFETYVYAHADELTADDLDDVYRNAVMKIYGDDELTTDNGRVDTGYDLMSYFYSITPETYWYLVCVESPGYYISYATSMLGALEVLATGNEDYQRGVDAYLSLLSSETESLSEALHNAGLTSPFDEETYQSIAALLRDSYIGGDN